MCACLCGYRCRTGSSVCVYTSCMHACMWLLACACCVRVCIRGAIIYKLVTPVQIHRKILTHVCSCMCIFMHVYVHAYVCLCMCMSVHACLCMFTILFADRFMHASYVHVCLCMFTIPFTDRFMNLCLQIHESVLFPYSHAYPLSHSLWGLSRRIYITIQTHACMYTQD
jgi:hypothetical protein